MVYLLDEKVVAQLQEIGSDLKEVKDKLDKIDESKLEELADLDVDSIKDVVSEFNDVKNRLDDVESKVQNIDGVEVSSSDIY